MSFANVRFSPPLPYTSDGNCSRLSLGAARESAGKQGDRLTFRKGTLAGIRPDPSGALLAKDVGMPPTARRSTLSSAPPHTKMLPFTGKQHPHLAMWLMTFGIVLGIDPVDVHVQRQW